MQLTLRQRRPQTARPTTLTIERPEYHEKTTHILNGIGGPAGGRMLHGKQGRRHGIRHAEGQLHRRRFDRRRIGRHFPDAGCALRPPSRRFHAYGHRRIGDAAVGYGDPDAEGIDKPYYAAEKSVEVLPRRAATVEMTATIANSQTVVRATEQFLNYFHDAQFTVTTASGNQFDFTPGSTPADEPVFVKSATTLKVTGTARRQSQTGTDEGPKVTFSEQTLEATSPRTCHVLTFDAKDAGSVTLTVTLSDDYTETRPIDCEVNEGAIDDTK